jgi:hypothetical protein
MASSLDLRKYLCYLPLTRFAPNCSKKAPVFSTTYEPPSPVTTSLFYHLRKKGRGRGACALVGLTGTRPDAIGRWAATLNAPTRPCLTPLFSTLSAKPYTNPPLSNSIKLNHFQTSCKAPLSKSFRMILFQNSPFFFLPPCFILTSCVRMRSLVLPTWRLS